MQINSNVEVLFTYISSRKYADTESSSKIFTDNIFVFQNIYLKTFPNLNQRPDPEVEP